jgi:hypothetical protein
MFMVSTYLLLRDQNWPRKKGGNVKRIELRHYLMLGVLGLFSAAMVGCVGFGASTGSDGTQLASKTSGDPNDPTKVACDHQDADDDSGAVEAKACDDKDDHEVDTDDDRDSVQVGDDKDDDEETETDNDADTGKVCTHGDHEGTDSTEVISDGEETDDDTVTAPEPTDVAEAPETR